MAAAVVTPSGLEDGVSRSRGEGAGEVVVERGPGAAYHMFVVMEDLVEKLKLLRYEEDLLRKNNLKPPSRWVPSSPERLDTGWALGRCLPPAFGGNAKREHYFALPTNPGEQFYMFFTLAAWLINKAGRPFEQPQEYDDPNATISNILSELRSFGRTADFPPSKLKSGYGAHVCYVLDCLAEEALKYIGFTWKRPTYPVEELEEETVAEDDAELTLNKVDEEFVEEETDNEENFIDLSVLKAQTYRLDMNESAKQEDILESTTDAAEWSLEVERVLPQLKVTIRTDNKDWRIHVDQMHQHKSGIESALKETKGLLDKLHSEISRTLEKIGSREKYINNQLEHLVQEYRAAQAQLSEARERYQQGNGGVTERTRLLSEVTEELEKVKQEMEEKGSSMTDGAPLVKIKQSLTKLKQETIQMDIRIGVVEHTLLQSKLKEKSNMTRDMHATIIPESAIGSY
ncbi:PREDICTED: intraflagellar transport protein 57 homolog isoform X1 [Lipotes vexillifer]|uniref:Intraflagellar transport protein 57 homolog n=1 Tax=Lipotes vexillifer TaxID=118797 RepID=A0A340WM34_LIPVE|nr:PREDICTED: intraflagellar transport protein 57 homolog isoform X1 [Lipotes vexillifer]